ncbi:valine--tRNA ligase [Clostridiales bacterium FE2011]|nr:valine--tRNA ligase [Clostridiales bacterium FE2011]QTE75870.1 valine--tRNA ligase [Clostridiales bacterium FE2010]
MSGADMATRFNPQEIEADIYKAWEESGAFTAHRVEGKKPFTIVMPPPNITGQLHMGHAMDCIMQDAPIRYHRMKGDPTLWLPGTDHAAIATEVRIVEAMRKEGLTKEGIGREAFLERAWNWKKEYGGRIVHQQRKMGISCDWSRERFTMDEGCSRAVREVFVRLYEKGLIYRGNRMINWCPACQSAISDAEVEYKDVASHLWHIRYPGADGSEGVVVATTRPETMLGDTGVAVNPADERYTNLVGKKVILPIVNKEIPVVADDYVEKEFGTGAVKMTPAHDPNDFEVAQRHNLEIITVTNDDGTMNENAGRFAGMDPMECRKAVVEELEKLGLLVKVEDYSHNVGFCYRHGNTPVEPRLSEQWFVKMKTLAEPAIAAVREGRTKFVPERFSKMYYNWMENIRDWCISRQLWWGHRIPVWYCDDCGEQIVSREDPTVCPKCGGKLRQDEDVLDTWFSSALWPFSTLGWPDNTEDLKYFYPTSMLVTGWDIITFWVSRMMVAGIENMGETPFETVLIHGLVRDEQGRKMSKSLGNGIDPLEVIDEYGTDALRFSLVMGVSPGNDTRYGKDKVEAARNFANKVWNASRFVLMNVNERKAFDPAKLETADKWILTRLQEAVKDISEHMEDGDFGLAATKIYDFAWSEFCDWYIELSKSRLLGEEGESKETVKAVLLFVLENLLKLLHPFMPFLTEQVYKYLPGSEGFLMLQSWPEYNEAYVFAGDEEKMQGVMEIIRTIRNLRSEMNVMPSKRTHLMLLPADGWTDTLKGGEGYFKKLAGAEQVELISDRSDATGKNVSAVVAAGELFIPLGDLVDFEKEVARLTKELENLKKEMARSNGMLNNQGFLAKAPAQLVQQEKDKLEAAKSKAAALENRIAELKENL